LEAYKGKLVHRAGVTGYGKQAASYRQQTHNPLNAAQPLVIHCRLCGDLFLGFRDVRNLHHLFFSRAFARPSKGGCFRSSGTMFKCTCVRRIN